MGVGSLLLDLFCPKRTIVEKKMWLPSAIENKAILAFGDSGQGKSTLAHQILMNLKDRAKLSPKNSMRSQKVCIYDPALEFFRRHYRPGWDYLFAPGIKESDYWDFAREAARSHNDLEIVAEELYPSSNGSDKNEFFTRAGCDILKTLLRAAAQHGQGAAELADLLRNRSLIELAIDSMGLDTVAPQSSPHQRDGVIGELSKLGAAFSKFPRQTKDRRSFTVADWADSSEDRWLFVASASEHRTATAEIVAGVLSLVAARYMRAVQDTYSDQYQRRWMILDEFGSISVRKKFKELLSEGRKYGTCTYISVWTPDEFRGYGEPSTMIGSANTLCVSRLRDDIAAEKLAKLIGSPLSETKATSYSVSKAPKGGTQTSASVSGERKYDYILSPREIARLRPNQLFLSTHCEQRQRAKGLQGEPVFMELAYPTFTKPPNTYTYETFEEFFEELPPLPTKPKERQKSDDETVEAETPVAQAAESKRRSGDDAPREESAEKERTPEERTVVKTSPTDTDLAAMMADLSTLR